jgi:hypothetical protein
VSIAVEITAHPPVVIEPRYPTLPDPSETPPEASEDDLG